MPLYVPCLPPYACPPLRFPPVPTIHAPAAAGLFFAVAAITQSCHALTLPPSVYLAALTAVGYAYISGVMLGRKDAMSSRYGNRNQFFAALGVAAACPLLGGGSWLAVSTLATRLLASLVFTASLHFLLLDNWPLLQSFGCKWSSPARWSSCSPAEAGVATGILVTAGTIIVTRVQMILQQHALYITLARFAFVMACVMLPLLANVRTHSLHVHHYLAAGALLPFTAFNDEVSALVQVAVFGIALDGIAVWGMDPAVIPTRVNLRASDVPTICWLKMLDCCSDLRRTSRLLHFLQTTFDASLDELAECEVMTKTGVDKIVLELRTLGVFLTGEAVRPALTGAANLLAARGAVPGTPPPVIQLRYLSGIGTLAQTKGTPSTPFAHATALAVLDSVALGLFGGSIELSGATSKLLQDEAAAGAGTPAPQDADASALQQVFARGINASRDRNQYWQRHGRARELRDAWRKIVCADPAAAAVYYTLQERIVATLDTL